eukprot:403365091
MILKSHLIVTIYLFKQGLGEDESIQYRKEIAICKGFIKVILDGDEDLKNYKKKQTFDDQRVCSDYNKEVEYRFGKADHIWSNEWSLYLLESELAIICDHFDLAKEQSTLKRISYQDILSAQVDENNKKQVVLQVYKKVKQNEVFMICRKRQVVLRQFQKVIFTLNEEQKAFGFAARLQSRLSSVQYVLNEMPRRRRLLVLINPFSGQKMATQNWAIAQPILEKAYLDMNIIHTQRAMHAYEIVSSLKIGEYDGIVTVSGDGLLHEVVNALFRHKHCEEILANGLTLGIIPGGTSNGLFKSLVEEAGEATTVESAAYLIARGRRRAIDLTEIDAEYSPNQKIYSFLSVFWAVLADCDINSEVIRWMGSPRFTVWGIYRILFMKRYHGSLYFNGSKITNQNDAENISQILTESSHLQNSLLPPVTQPILSNHSNISQVTLQSYENKQFSYFFIQNSPYIGIKIHSAPMAKINDGFNDIVVQEANQGRFKLTNQLLQHDDGSYFNQNNGELKNSLGIDYLKCTEWRLDPFLKTPCELTFDSEGNQVDNRIYPQNYEYDESAFFSIDGEKYPAQRIQGRVLKGALPIYY